jgi:hypothetical protein
MLPSDPTAQVAAIGIFTTFITTIGVILVAILNNRKERGDAADSGVELALREQVAVREERIILRDEQIRDLQGDVTALKSRLAEEIEGNEMKSAVIASLQKDNATLRRGDG